MKKDWTKKCTCENFQQNEDCEHIGNKVLEEVGLGVDDKDCPDCLPYDGGEEGGCAKHFIKDGVRHDRLGGTLTGALTPLGEVAEAIQVFRNTMAQDRCYGHCKTYQEEIQKLSDIANKVRNI
jgi:hypothetical protein